MFETHVHNVYIQPLLHIAMIHYVKYKYNWDAIGTKKNIFFFELNHYNNKILNKLKHVTNIIQEK